MEGWTETWRGIVSPWECDITEHFTIAYYFDRLADATSTMAGSLGSDGPSRSVARRYDVRFVRELRAGASFHILSAPLAIDEASLRLGHQFLDSVNAEVTAWVEETLDITPSTLEGFIPTARDRVKPMDLGPDGNFTLAAFVHRFTAASVQALAAIGATASYLESARKGYSTFELALQASGWPRLGSPVLVETGIVHLGNSSIRFMHRMSDPVDGRELARLSQFGVQLDLDTRRPAALPETLRAAAARLLIPVS